MLARLLNRVTGRENVQKISYTGEKGMLETNNGDVLGVM